MTIVVPPSIDGNQIEFEAFSLWLSRQEETPTSVGHLAKAYNRDRKKREANGTPPMNCLGDLAWGLRMFGPTKAFELMEEAENQFLTAHASTGSTQQ